MGMKVLHRMFGREERSECPVEEAKSRGVNKEKLELMRDCPVTIYLSRPSHQTSKFFWDGTPVADNLFWITPEDGVRIDRIEFESPLGVEFGTQWSSGHRSLVLSVKYKEIEFKIAIHQTKVVIG